MIESTATEDPDDIGSGEEEEEDDLEESGPEQSTPEKRARHAITGRGVTLSMLMADNIIQPGEELLSLEYLGQKFTADLLPNGKIKSNETGQFFASPSSWAIFCKKLVNPAKKSGCGWASVKYKGRKLDSWKTSWFRLVKPRKPNIPGGQSPARSVTSDIYLSSDGMSESESKMSETFLKTDADVRGMSHNKSDSNISGLSLQKSDSNISDLSLHKSDSNISDMSLKKSDSNISGMSCLTNDGSLCGMSLHRNDSNVSGLSLLRNDSGMALHSTAKTVTEPSFVEDVVLDLTTKTKPKREESVPPETTRTRDTDVCYMVEQEEALNLSLKANPTPVKVVVKQEPPSDQSDISQSDRKPVVYSTLPERSQNVDQNLLVECEEFAAVNKVQPYTVSMSTNSLLLMDFHCHLTTSEVVGYLGGKWDQSTQHLSIQQAFPCRCRLGDSQSAPLIEDEIRANMKHLSMSLVGWYHSHPYNQPEPSIKDIDCQMSYQLRMKGARANYFPCVGMINSPYYGKSLRTESSLQMYMVMPPPDTTQTDFGIPMKLKYIVNQNRTVSDGLLSQMQMLVEFYRGSPDWITFEHSWHPGITYLEKLKTSMNNKLPEDQTDEGNFLDFVQHILAAKH